MQHTAMNDHLTLGTFPWIYVHSYLPITQIYTYLSLHGPDSYLYSIHNVIGLLTPVDMQFQCTHTPNLPVSGQGQGQGQGQGLPATDSSLPQWSMVSNKHEFWQATTFVSALRDESEITISFSDFCTVSLRVTSRCGVHITTVVKVRKTYNLYDYVTTSKTRSFSVRM